MNNLDDFMESDKKPNVLIDYLLISVGMLFIIGAIGLFVLWMGGDRGFEGINILMPSEKASYEGELILYTPAGSKDIEALIHSSQIPVVVMFDADW